MIEILTLYYKENFAVWYLIIVHVFKTLDLVKIILERQNQIEDINKS